LINMETSERGFATTGVEEFLEPYKNGKVSFQEHFEKLKQLTSDNPKQQERLDLLQKKEKDWLADEVDHLIALRRQVGNGQVKIEDVVAFIKSGKGKQNMDEMRKILADITTDETALLDKRSKELKEQEKNTKIAMIGGSMIAVVLSIVFAVFITRGITKPVNILQRELTQLAQNGGDLRKDIKVDSKDELGDLANAINHFLADLRGIMAQVLRSSESVASSTEELTASSEQSAQAADQVAGSINDMAKVADEQLVAASEASAVVQQMSASIQQIAANANQVSVQSAQATEKARDGGQSVERAVSQMNAIEQSSQVATEAVAKLNDKSKEIGQIVDTISGIAGQTNLLALNAAIEAARAGEQGRGFAVVAEEVRKLAENSQEAAKQIAKLIGEIQVDTDKAVVAMGSGAREVKLGTDVVTAAGQSFREIVSLVSNVSGQVKDISTEIEQIAIGSQQIVGSVKKIDGLSKTSAAEAQSISAATEEQLASMEEIASSSQSLAKLAQDLQAAVGKFQV
jgi:methyl-accepting chemotaxis protein